VRLIGAPGELRDVELDVLGWRTEEGETALICRLVDGSSGTVPARWTDLPCRVSSGPELGVLASPAGWRLLSERLVVCALGGVRGAAQSLLKTEVAMSGQLALQVGVQESVAPAVVWETLPIDCQVQVTLRLARLLAVLVEASRDE